MDLTRAIITASVTQAERACVIRLKENLVLEALHVKPVQKAMPVSCANCVRDMTTLAAKSPSVVETVNVFQLKTGKTSVCATMGML